MGFTNSPLVSYTKISPNRTPNRNHAIDTITIHCVVGQCSVETLGNVFAPESRQASSNYGVGVDGRIGMYCEEKDRSWCSSSASNDHRAITIEVASDTAEPYAVKDVAYNATIQLVADICKRNGIKKLVWSTDKNTRINHLNGCNMTVHRDYANKSCPGTYLYDRMGDIAAKVNAILGATESPKQDTNTGGTSTTIKANDIVTINSDKATYYDGKTSVPAWVRKKQWIVKEVKGDRAVIDKSVDGENAINSPINTKYLTAVKTTTEAAFTPYLVKVNTDALNIRKGAGTNYAVTGCIKDKGTYTIIAESAGQGATKWGKLKSGAGWISLDYCIKK